MNGSMHTGQELDRTEVNQDDSSIHLTRAWRAAFTAQATQDMMDDVTAYAASRASWLEQQSGRRSPGLIRELVQDAIGDTFAGVVAWDPQRFPLSLHVKSVIRSRLSHEMERAEAYDHVDVAEAPEEEISAAMETAAEPASRAELAHFVDEFVARLRADAEGDEPVLALIELYRDGITERRDACRRGRMSATTYHNARRRLKRIVENLPEHLRTAAIEAMA